MREAGSCDVHPLLGWKCIKLGLELPLCTYLEWSEVDSPRLHQWCLRCYSLFKIRGAQRWELQLHKDFVLHFCFLEKAITVFSID